MSGRHPIPRLHKHLGWHVGIGAWAGRNFKRCNQHFPIQPANMDDKLKLEHHEAAEDPYAVLTPEEAECWRRYQGKEGKKVVRKVRNILPSHSFSIADISFSQIDLRLITVLGVLYLLSHIDRGNIGNAKIEGMDKDIGLTGNQYNIASTIFFVPYILFGKHLRMQTRHWALTISRDPLKHHHQEDTT